MTVLRPMPSCFAKARVGGNEEPLESRPLRMSERRIAYNCRWIGTDEPRSTRTLSKRKLARFMLCEFSIAGLGPTICLHFMVHSGTNSEGGRVDLIARSSTRPGLGRAVN